MRDNHNSSGVFTYFLTGAVVGVALGIWFAPNPGEETRESVANWLKEQRERASELLAKFRSQAPEVVEKAVDSRPKRRKVPVTADI